MTPFTILVKDVMTRTVFAVAPETSLEIVARVFARHDITGLPVVDRRGRVVGMISQADLVQPRRGRSEAVGLRTFYRVANTQREICLQDGPLGHGIVEELMSPVVPTIGQMAPAEDAARTMLSDHARHVLVVDRGEIVGIITATDVMRPLARGWQRAA